MFRREGEREVGGGGGGQRERETEEREREREGWGGRGERHQFKVQLRDVAIQLWLPCYLEVSSPLNLKQLSQDSLTLGTLHVLPRTM